MDSELPGVHPSGNARRRIVRPRNLALALVFLVVVGVMVSAFITVPDEAIVPGSTTKVANLISLPSGDRHRAPGSVSLVDVELVQLRALDYLFYRLNSNDQVLPTSEITGSVSQSQYNEQGVLEMATAQQAATVVGLRALGYHVIAAPDGVVVFQLEPNSTTSLTVGDVIRSVDGHPVATINQLHDAVVAGRPGQRIVIGVQRFGATHVTTSSMRLGRVVKANTSSERCAAVTAPKRYATGTGCIGIYIEQLYTTRDAPFKIGMSAEGIVGPSAGLAFTLGVIEELDPGNLTGGKAIAATGTMSLDGAVGDVGGVAQKTIAVRASGASVFFVPRVEYSVAKSHAGSTLKVVPVTNISQVLNYLEHHGGTLVTKSTK